MSEYSELSDKELLESYPKESGKIAELISRYMKIVFAGARKYSSSADYEDLVSDGMEGLLSAVTGYDSKKGEFAAFAAVCVENRLKSTVKRALRRNARLADTDPEQLNDIADPAPTPEEVVIEREDSENMLKLIRSELTPLETRCLEGAAMGLSYNEISEGLNVDRKTVDNALSRARTKLRRFYRK